MYSGLTAKLSIVKGKDAQNKEILSDICYISNWSVEETRDIIEITKLGLKNKEKMPSLYSWSASADGTADFADDGQKQLRTAMKDGKLVNIKFYLDDGSTSGKIVYLTGEAYIESMSIDISAEDKGNISISLSGIGELDLPEEVAEPASTTVV